MALRDIPSTFCRLSKREIRSAPICYIGRNCRRYASAEAAPAKEIPEDFQDLESQSSFTSTTLPKDAIGSYDPVKVAKGRKRELPASRYESDRS